jgi:hypothetical protein
MSRHLRMAVVWMLSALAMSVAGQSASAGKPFVPGTGEFMEDCSDNFEDEGWSYTYNFPKSSQEQDERTRSPGGFSNNRLWHEGAKRGTPDIVKRVPTPPDGIPGSAGALMFATKNSGIPNTMTGQQQQDDLLMKFDRRLGRSIPVSWQPSCTVRVYLPPWDQWEHRNGPSFGMRGDCRGVKNGTIEPYWPGRFFLFRPGNEKKGTVDQAKLTVRAGPRGNDIRSHDVTEPGWWTLGMSFSPDGQIHYYAHAGVEDLTEDDFLMSSYPYNMKCVSFNNFFFNVANWDNGRSWSTKWVIDDPQIFVIPPQGQTAANLYRNRNRSQRGKQMTRSNSTSPSSASRSSNNSQR